LVLIALLGPRKELPLPEATRIQNASHRDLWRALCGASDRLTAVAEGAAARSGIASATLVSPVPVRGRPPSGHVFVHAHFCCEWRGHVYWCVRLLGARCVYDSFWHHDDISRWIPADEPLRGQRPVALDDETFPWHRLAHPRFTESYYQPAVEFPPGSANRVMLRPGPASALALDASRGRAFSAARAKVHRPAPPGADEGPRKKARGAADGSSLAPEGVGTEGKVRDAEGGGDASCSHGVRGAEDEEEGGADGRAADPAPERGRGHGNRRENQARARLLAIGHPTGCKCDECVCAVQHVGTGRAGPKCHTARCERARALKAKRDQRSRELGEHAKAAAPDAREDDTSSDSERSSGKRKRAGRGRRAAAPAPRRRTSRPQARRRGS
jgi:hypothetical protein